MLRRLHSESLDESSQREVEMALEELDVMWEELQGQTALLERENARYAEFFEFAPDAYVITDPGGAIREANEAAAELFRAARVQPRDGSALACEFSVRTIPLRKSGAAGLCWLIRPV